MEYHKIDSVFKRNPASHRFIDGDWSRPEFGYLADLEWEFTEKVDGTNIRIGWDGNACHLGGRTDSANIQQCILDWWAAHNERLRVCFYEIFGCPAVIYGEGYGPKIQSGGKYRPDHSVVVFDVRVGKIWLKREGVLDVCHKAGLDCVPIIGRGTLADAIAMCRSGFQSKWGDFPAEGIVARPAIELLDRMGQRIIAKVKVGDF
jgi:hypothetical protein